jgi:response regulator RpfG family c-di-GMP phosphodiesterase
MTAAPAPKILFVDDDPNVLASFERGLRGRFTFETAVGSAAALEYLKHKGPYAVIVADMRMPGMSGLELLEQVRTSLPDTVRLMLTGNADQQTAVDAINRGQVFSFLNKPCGPEQLTAALDRALRQYDIVRTERDVLENTLAGTTRLLAEVLGMVAPPALGRGQHLRDSVGKLAQDLKLEPRWELELAALLSPIGFASVPAEIVHKLRSELTPYEEAIAQRVPQIGHDLLRHIPRLETVAQIVLYQQKCFDGGGYPCDALRGVEIPLGARLLKIVADRMDLEADGIVKSRAKQAMVQRVGAYDPQLLEQCFVSFPEFLTQTINTQNPVLTVSLADLREGWIAVTDICTLGGLILVAAGNRLTPMILERLRNYGELQDVKEPILVQAAASPAAALARAPGPVLAPGAPMPLGQSA